MMKLCFCITVIVLVFARQARSCGHPGAPPHATLSFSSDDIGPGTVATHSCDRGFELLGPSRRICAENGTWIPVRMPFCVLNVAMGKAPMQSSIARNGIPQKAVDGSTSIFYNGNTCSLTEVSNKPWWYVNLLEPYMVQLVRVDFGKSCCANNSPATVVVRIGNNRPDLKSNPICNKFTGYIEEGRPLLLPCNPPMPGTFVSVTLERPASQELSICETFVYTDQALPIERCPSFRDQPLGSTATYNGKCYIFYNNQQKNFESSRKFCDQRGGSLVDETSPALQGFLSWELWRRHRSDPNAKYWMGAVRSRSNANLWKWLNGKEVSMTFWNKPGGNQNCSGFDGAKGWLWSDTNCNQKINFICQHKPRTCGQPEQPSNSTLLARNFNIGSKVEFRCSPGHLLVGPETRTCMSDGFYSEYTPKCKYLVCPMPFPVTNGEYRLLNGTMSYQSIVQYRCIDGYQLRGRSFLKCDVNEKWNGPPPTCHPIYCKRPPSIRNGAVRQSRNTSIAGTTAEYRCKEGYNLIGKQKLMCLSSGQWDTSPPTCREVEKPTTTTTEPPPTTTRRIRTRLPTLAPRRPGTSRDPEILLTPKPTRRGTLFSTRRPKPTRVYVTKRTRWPRPTTKRPYEEDLQPEGSKEVPIVTKYPGVGGSEDSIGDSNSVYDSNAIAGSSDEVTSRNKKTTKLNLGGIIALGVFGGFVFLAAIVTIIVILVRRTMHKKTGKGSPDNTTITTYDSSSDNDGKAGLNKYYRKAWENLRYDNSKSVYPDEEKVRNATLARLDHGLRRPGAFSEGYREANEIVVSDVAALYSRPDRRPSGHGRQHRHNDSSSHQYDNRGHARSLSHGSARHLDDLEVQAWYHKQLGSQSRRSVF